MREQLEEMVKTIMQNEKVRAAFGIACGLDRKVVLENANIHFYGIFNCTEIANSLAKKVIDSITSKDILEAIDCLKLIK